MATEAQRRLGGINYTGFDARIQHWLTGSYLDLCTTYHHFELDKLDTTTLTLSTSTNTLNLPADCFEVIGMSLRNVAGTAYVGEVGIYSAAALLPAYIAEAGLPTRRVRYLNTLYFDKKPDLAYKVDLYYYRRPTDPDFAGSVYPDTSWDMDEHIIQGALSLANPSIGRPDHGAVQRELLKDWLAMQVRPALQYALEGRERHEPSVTLGGAQG